MKMNEEVINYRPESRWSYRIQVVKIYINIYILNDWTG